MSLKPLIAHNLTMRMIMTIENLKTISALELFFEGSQEIVFSVPGNKTERYRFIQKELVKFGYLNSLKIKRG